MSFSSSDVRYASACRQLATDFARTNRDQNGFARKSKFTNGSDFVKSNPPHGSVEIVQILSTKELTQSMTHRAENNAMPYLNWLINGSIGSPRRASKDFGVVCRKDLNHPPTAVGGIKES